VTLKKKLGMTLVEVLVAIVIGVISVAALFYSYNIFNKSYQSVVDKVKISSSSRNALSTILKDLRNAGYCDINYNGSCDRLIEKKDNRYAEIKNYKVNWYQYYRGDGTDYLALEYNISPTERVEIRYYLVAYDRNNLKEANGRSTFYLAREEIENPSIDYTYQGQNYGLGKRMNCQNLKRQKECAPIMITPFVSDFQVVFKDKKGKELNDVCFNDCTLQIAIDNQKEVHTVEIYLTVRSPNQIYKKDRTIIITNHNPGKKGFQQTITDRYHRETFFASTYLRNIVLN
jgi:prepilin-type N-terminal cleavage/methylation domain-containing protein|tara:strand:- start:76 stop:936 length:861 start_codon:yes stop_codon:yes gene_type:complete